MSPCTMKLQLLLAGLALALSAASFASALPIKRDVQTVAVFHIVSLHTGHHVHVHEDGNVTAFPGKEGFEIGKFYFSENSVNTDSSTVRHNISLDHKGSYLHFVQYLETNESGNFSANYSGNGNETALNSTAKPEEE